MIENRNNNCKRQVLWTSWSVWPLTTQSSSYSPSSCTRCPSTVAITRWPRDQVTKWPRDQETKNLPPSLIFPLRSNCFRFSCPCCFRSSTYLWLAACKNIRKRLESRWFCFESDAIQMFFGHMLLWLLMRLCGLHHWWRCFLMFWLFTIFGWFPWFFKVLSWFLVGFRVFRVFSSFFIVFKFF